MKSISKKTYITSKKEIDKIVAKFRSYKRNRKHPVILRGIRFPKGYNIEGFGGELDESIKFVDCDLRGLDLSQCWFSTLVAKDCNLRGMNLSEYVTTLRLEGCDLRDCHLDHMNLVFRYGRSEKSYDRLHNCDLRGADFEGADFDGLKERSKLYKQLSDTIPMACPATGKYTAYKKLSGDWIAELEIPEHAKRSSAGSTGKCRASEAIVKRIYKRRKSGSVITRKSGESLRSCDRIRYVVGQTVKPDGFCTNRFQVCAQGIHHFMTETEAEDYTF